MKSLCAALLITFSLALALPISQAYADPGAGDVPALASDVQNATAIPTDTFIRQVVRVWADFHAGGLPVGLKIALVTLLILALFKVSFLQAAWNKLGAFKAWAAPILGLVLGLSLFSVQGPLTLAGVLGYLSAGAGAILFHELLDTIKAIPGLGSTYVSIINIITGILGGSK